MKPPIPMLDQIEQTELPVEKRLLGTSSGRYGWSAHNRRAKCARRFALTEQLQEANPEGSRALMTSPYLTIGSMLHAYVQDWHLKGDHKTLHFYHTQEELEAEEKKITMLPEHILTVEQTLRQYKNNVPPNFFGRVIDIERRVEFSDFLTKENKSEFPRTTALDMVVSLNTQDITMLSAAYKKLQDYYIEPGLYAIDWKFVGRDDEKTEIGYQYNLQFPYSIHAAKQSGIPLLGLFVFVVTKSKYQRRKLIYFDTEETLEYFGPAVDEILMRSDTIEAIFQEEKDPKNYLVNPAACESYGSMCQMLQLNLCNRA